MAPKNYQLPTNNYPLKSHECTNGMFLRLDWSGIHNRWLLEMRYEGSHECTNGMFLRLDWRKEGKPRVA